MSRKLAPQGCESAVAQQLDHGVRRHQVLPRESGAVVKRVLIARDAGLVEKSAQHFESAFDRARGALFAAQQAQQDFRVQVLADFVDDPHIFNQRPRLIAGQHQRLVLQRA